MHVAVMVKKDHVNMVKFDTADDDCFSAVLHYLEVIMKSVREAEGKRKADKQVERDVSYDGLCKGIRLCREHQTQLDSRWNAYRYHRSRRLEASSLRTEARADL